MEGAERLQEELAAFRQEWHEELYVEKESDNIHLEESITIKEKEIEEQAAQLFLKGTKLEREGNFNAAVYYYREAVKLVPDIEFKIAKWESRNDELDFDGIDSEEEEEEVGDPLNKNDLSMESISEQLDALYMSGLCAPEYPQKITHISALPSELLMYVIRWVVTKDLDIKSLLRFSEVCKWFYVCAKDEELWKLICIRLWGINCSVVHQYNSCWKTMFLMKPHLRYDGLYISENSYVRIGEQSVDSFYKPFHLVEYFKYLRFFANGTCLIYTSTEDPQTVVPMLLSPPYRDENIYFGYWRLSGEDEINIAYNRVTKPTVLEVQRRKRTNRNHKPDIKEHNFYMKLQLTNTKKKTNNKLMWDSYTCRIKHCATGSTMENEINMDSFRPFFFSGVKSYCQYARKCL